MKTEEDYRVEAQRLRERVENLEYERDALLVGIAEATEALGHSGGTVDDLRDAVGQLERLLVGKDVDAGLDLVGIAGQVEALVIVGGYFSGRAPKPRLATMTKVVEQLKDLWPT